MEAASAGHIEIVRLLVAHGADVNAQSTSGLSFIPQCSIFEKVDIEILVSD